MNDVWQTQVGKEALKRYNKNLALAKAFVAGYDFAKDNPEDDGLITMEQFADEWVKNGGIPPHPVKEPNNAPTEEEFDLWWNMYDKKRSRKKVIQKWFKMSAKKRADCIAATPAYVASTPDKQYRKDPFTYLNQECYYDEIINPSENAKQFNPAAKAAAILSKS